MPSEVLSTAKHDHAIGCTLGRQIRQDAVEGRQPSATTECEGQQVSVGHLTQAQRTGLAGTRIFGYTTIWVTHERCRSVLQDSRR